jgi:hypothetical protein
MIALPTIFFFDMNFMEVRQPPQTHRIFYDAEWWYTKICADQMKCRNSQYLTMVIPMEHLFFFLLHTVQHTFHGISGTYPASCTDLDNLSPILHGSQ